MRGEEKKRFMKDEMLRAAIRGPRPPAQCVGESRGSSHHLLGDGYLKERTGCLPPDG